MSAMQPGVPATPIKQGRAAQYFNYVTYPRKHVRFPWNSPITYLSYSGDFRCGRFQIGRFASPGSQGAMIDGLCR